MIDRMELFAFMIKSHVHFDGIPANRISMKMALDFIDEWILNKYGEDCSQFKVADTTMVGAEEKNS